MQTNAIMRMNLQYSIFLVFYGTFATCQAEETTEKVHSEKNYTTTNEGNYLEQKNANDLKEKESTSPTPFSVAVIHSENRAYTSKGKSIIPIHSKAHRNDNPANFKINKDEVYKRQSANDNFASNGDEMNPNPRTYDTREHIYIDTFQPNRHITSYFPQEHLRYGNVYDYKRSSKGEDFKDVKRLDDLMYNDFGSWKIKSIHNSPYFSNSDESRPLHEPNLAKELEAQYKNLRKFGHEYINYLLHYGTNPEGKLLKPVEWAISRAENDFIFQNRPHPKLSSGSKFGGYEEEPPERKFGSYFNKDSFLLRQS